MQMKQLSDEVYKTFVEICKSDRGGKGIRICVLSGNGDLDFLRELNSYDDKYVRIIKKMS